MSNSITSEYTTNSSNPCVNKQEVSLDEYLAIYGSRIVQDSELLFVQDFLFPLLGPKGMKYVIPQYPFIDSEGKSRRIDFGLLFNDKKIAIEVNGETYHAEGIIPNENFDDNLNRQNEILNAGWYLLRFSYSQLQSPIWRKKVANDLFTLLRRRIPELISENVIEPNSLQKEALESLDYYRGKGWKKGIVVLPTGTGKTFLSAFDALKSDGRILFIVHRLDILNQSMEAFEKLFPNEKSGKLTGEEKSNLADSKVLFASKDSLRNADILNLFAKDTFAYIIVDEVHHGQSPTYQTILQYFDPTFFMLGLTATPDRMDRKDIFELFDYQKVFEYTLADAIDNGFLVPYTYYGLTDNIDYSSIRYNGKKYNIADLNKNLIIHERNEKILEEYIARGKANKALGFCCSIKHANAMAKFFSDRGVPAVAITSETPNRSQVIQDFRDNRYAVAFTVDLFNEGIDFPDLQVLLFLRPTESKTVFMQQLGRGLRLCGTKNNVTIIDFIGNYKKANNIRKLLSRSSTPITNQHGGIEKIEYEYSPKCRVIFDVEVEELLDRQDMSGREISKEDLIFAYYVLAEQLGHKPQQEEINRDGEFKVSRYTATFGSWRDFLKEIGEFTEFSYHFPQGTHLGHVMYILDTVGGNKVLGSHIDPKHVKFSGSYDSGIAGNFQRQTKYKLQAMMEMGLLVDFRKESQDFFLMLTSRGQDVYFALRKLFPLLDLSFVEEDAKNKDISWAMNCESSINRSIREFLMKSKKRQPVVRNAMLNMDAVSLLLKYLYVIQRKKIIKKSDIYDDFFNAPFVKQYLDRHGLDLPTADVRCRRIPFLFNLLDSLGIINQTQQEIDVQLFVPTESVMRFYSSDTQQTIETRILLIRSGISISSQKWTPEELSLMREQFGVDFLTSNYYLPIETT